MKRKPIILLTVLSTVLVFSGQSFALQGPNICIRQETYTVIARVSEQKPYTERRKAWCWSVPPTCSTYKIVFKTVITNQTLTKQRPVEECCKGYTLTNDGDRCIPICSESCVYGVCSAPDVCKCEAGYGGPTCNISDTLDNQEQDDVNSPTQNSLVPNVTRETVQRPKPYYPLPSTDNTLDEERNILEDPYVEETIDIETTTQSSHKEIESSEANTKAEDESVGYEDITTYRSDVYINKVMPGYLSTLEPPSSTDSSILNEKKPEQQGNEETESKEIEQGRKEDDEPKETGETNAKEPVDVQISLNDEVEDSSSQSNESSESDSSSEKEPEKTNEEEDVKNEEVSETSYEQTEQNDLDEEKNVMIEGKTPELSTTEGINNQEEISGSKQDQESSEAQQNSEEKTKELTTEENPSQLEKEEDPSQVEKEENEENIVKAPNEEENVEQKDVIKNKEVDDNQNGQVDKQLKSHNETIDEKEQRRNEENDNQDIETGHGKTVDDNQGQIPVTTEIVDNVDQSNKEADEHVQEDKEQNEVNEESPISTEEDDKERSTTQKIPHQDDGQVHDEEQEKEQKEETSSGDLDLQTSDYSTSTLLSIPSTKEQTTESSFSVNVTTLEPKQKEDNDKDLKDDKQEDGKQEEDEDDYYYTDDDDGFISYAD